MEKADLEKLIDCAIKGSELNEQIYISKCFYEANNRSIHPINDLNIMRELSKLMNEYYDYGVAADKTCSYFKWTDNGKEAKKAGGHFAYQAMLSQKEKVKADIERLSYENLEYSVEELKRKLKDYPKMECRSRWAIIIAVIAAAGTLAQVVVSALK